MWHAPPLKARRSIMTHETDTSNEHSRVIPVVGIGASAGGLEALERFFAHVPADAPLAFVVVQHLHAEHPSSMPEILAQHTRLAVGPGAW